MLSDTENVCEHVVRYRKVLDPIAKNIQEIYWILQSDTEDISDSAEFNTGIIFAPVDKYRKSCDPAVRYRNRF
jgi:hypothetical protein